MATTTTSTNTESTPSPTHSSSYKNGAAPRTASSPALNGSSTKVARTELSTFPLERTTPLKGNTSTNSSNNMAVTANSQVSLHLGPSDDSPGENGHNAEDEYHRQMLIYGDTDFSCGLGGCHPRWLQRFANKQTFLFLFCLTSVLQGVYYTYFVSVLTTIEKLYQIPSKTTGFIMSSTEIGQISGALLLTYYGGQGHRPRWIATGMLVFATAAILCSTPHYLFGSQRVTSTTASYSLSTTDNQASNQISTSAINALKKNIETASLCLRNGADSGSNRTGIDFDSLMPDVASTQCLQNDIVDRRSQVTNSVLGIFFISLLLIGLGTTAVNTLGIPYIDDNVAPKESPLYFGITIGVRIFGPVCGFLLGSICTSIPAEFPFGSSDLTPADANWIGAWWLGLFMVGISLAITAFPMMVFPRRLPQPDPSSYCHQQQQQSLLQHKERLMLEMQEQRQPQEVKVAVDDPVKVEPTSEMSDEEHEPLNQQKNKQLQIVVPPSDVAKTLKLKRAKKEDTPTLQGFSVAVIRLLRNDILLFRTASSVLHILPISGLYTFLPKYLESQFQLTATDANIIAGLAGILVMGFGVFSSGTFMRKYKPSASFVARWLAFAALSYVLGMVALMFLGCSTAQIAGLPSTQRDPHGKEFFTTIDGATQLECSASCHCVKGRFEPVCLDGVTYISPCQAGCSTLYNNSTERYYQQCSCTVHEIPSLSSDSLVDTVNLHHARAGLCPQQCNTLTLYIVIFSITVLLHSTSEVGSMLLTLRCVEPHDKAMALGFISFAISLFGNVPCPIIYGAIVDSTCLFWEQDKCGKLGACRLYDSVRFRQWFHGITALIMFLAFCIDLVVCYKASGIQFNEEVSGGEQNSSASPKITSQQHSLEVAANQQNQCET